ncbi:MAG: hypothetical protein JW763_03980 [candidate division Zixibacteria bacterium]|nr:hypothetical protein [candidate division Zixibacteria bacterium]
MLRRIVPVVAVLFLMTAVAPVFAQTEDEIVAKYLQKAEKKHKTKVGFLSANFSYGRLAEDNGYRQFNFAATSDLSTLEGLAGPTEGIFRSKQFGLDFGMMLAPKMAVKMGFEYWLKMSTDINVDYDMSIGVLEVEDMYQSESEVSVYGFRLGFDYYLLNPPDRYGKLNNLAVKVGAGGGMYMASWDFWQSGDAESDPLKANSPGFWVQGGVEYPIGFFDMAVAADLSYFYLNFSGFESYNASSGDLQLTYPGSTDEIELDFSGLRGKVELKKFFSW